MKCCLLSLCNELILVISLDFPTSPSTLFNIRKKTAGFNMVHVKKYFPEPKVIVNCLLVSKQPKDIPFTII